MQEIDWPVVSTVVSSVTAVIAIVAPVATSILTIKAQERMKKMELYSPRVYDALAEMSLRYSRLIRGSASRSEEEWRTEYSEATNRLQEFRAASYTVMSLVPGKGIQKQILDLLNSFDHSLSPDKRQDEMFSQLMNDINEYMLTSKVKDKKQSTKE